MTTWLLTSTTADILFSFVSGFGDTMCTLKWVAWTKCRTEAGPRCEPDAGRTDASDFTFQERHPILPVSRFKHSYDAEGHYELVVGFAKSTLFETRDRQPKYEDMTGEARRV